METNKVLMWGGLAAVAYYLFLKPSTPGASSSASTPILNNLLPGSTPSSTVAVNSSATTDTNAVSNYAALLAANPNLGNPNYQMTAAENAQYLANYLDLRQALPGWVGHKMMNGVTPANLQQAAQVHWNEYGCSEKRVFVPLQPPSAIPYTPPPTPPKSSGGSIWSSILNVAGSVAVAALAGTVDESSELQDAKGLEIFVTGSAVLKKILPIYLEVDPNLVDSIEFKVDDLLSRYSD